MTERFHRSEVVVAQALVLKLLGDIELRVVNLDSVTLSSREEDSALHHGIHQALLLILTLATANTLTTIPVAHSRAIAPLEGASSSR